MEQKPPEVPEGVSQFYLPLGNLVAPAGAQLLYQARLLGSGEVTFLDKRRGIQHRLVYHRLAKPPAVGQPVRWLEAEQVSETAAPGPQAGGHWTEVPEAFQTAKKIKALEKSYADFLYDNAKITIRENSKLGLVGKPGEDLLAFRERCRAAAWQEAEKTLAAEMSKYQPRFEALGSKVPDSGGPGRGGFSITDMINPLKWIFGGSAKAAPRTARQQEALGRLEAEWFARRAAIFEKWKQIGEEYAEIQLTPRRADVHITRFGLGWAPFWQIRSANGGMQMVPAYR
jgi:hypothetical protein